MTAMAKTILVIGYGNTLRNDDGVGQHIAREVAAQGWPGVRSIAVTQLTPELAADAAQAQLVIFVDAVEGAVAQGVQAMDISAQAATGAVTQSAMTHHATPQGLLAMAQALYGACPRAMLVSVPGVNFELGEGLSGLALQGTQLALRLIGLRVVNHLKQEATRA
jgi:hydrogenase maturation protease